MKPITKEKIGWGFVSTGWISTEMAESVRDFVSDGYVAAVGSRELEKAEKFIFLEYFIIEEGYMWGRILDVLTRKAKEGVEVRVMYDGMCEMSTLPVDYWKLLNKAGIKAKPFSTIKPIVSSHYNYRDHRKILVIDGKVAFNGGVNLADEYINRIERFGHWKDTAVMISGPAAKDERGVKMTERERKAEIERLEKEMRKAARMLEYEYAAVLRDELIRLRGEK